MGTVIGAASLCCVMQVPRGAHQRRRNKALVLLAFFVSVSVAVEDGIHDIEVHDDELDTSVWKRKYHALVREHDALQRQVHSLGRLQPRELGEAGPGADTAVTPA